MIVAVMVGTLLAASGMGLSASSDVVVIADLDEAVPRVLEPHVPDQVLLRLREGVTDEQLAAVLPDVGGKVMFAYSLVPGLRLVSVQVPVREAIFKLGGHGDLLRYVEPDHLCSPTVTPNDPQYAQMYGLLSARAPQAWDLWTGDPNFVVAVCDTGIEVTHEDLVSNLWANPGEIAGNGIDDDGNGLIDDIHGWNFLGNNADLTNQDSVAHGTHVAGTIAATGNNGIGSVGVCWRAKVLSAKWLAGAGATSNFVRGFEYVLARGVRLSNHSWGGPDDPAVTDAIASARAAGHLMIAAAGNDSSQLIRSPGNSGSDNVITVSAIDQNDHLAGFSNWNARDVDLAAPGVAVLSTSFGNMYRTLDGTSMACPHVTGVAALLWSLHPEWSYQDVRDVILETTRPVANLTNIVATGGVVDAGAAVHASRPLRIELVNALPAEVQAGATLVVQVHATGSIDLSGALTVRYRQAGQTAFASVTMTSLGADRYQASLPVGPCSGTFSLYFEALLLNDVFSYPLPGAFAPLTALVLPFNPVFADDFEADHGWTVGAPGDSATVGLWARATPQVTLAQPGGDRHSAAGTCFVTGPLAGIAISSFDLDGGVSSFVSPAIDLSGRTDLSVGYWVWFSTNKGANPADSTDRLVVQVSSDDGATWQQADIITSGTTEAQGGWKFRSFPLDPALPRTAQMRLKFQAGDQLGPSVVEAAIDDVYIAACDQTPACPGDFNHSGAADVHDLFGFLAAWFTGVPEGDFNHDSGINVQDILDFLTAWFVGC